jgi:hypothetical protein
VQGLVNRGWKLITHDADSIQAKRQHSQSEFPQKNTTTWYITLEEQKQIEIVLKATIHVPAFADSPYSRTRIHEQFEEIAERTGDFETRESLKTDILSTLRIRISVS